LRGRRDCFVTTGICTPASGRIELADRDLIEAALQHDARCGRGDPLPG
jgi:hypothetical protein